MSNKDYYQVLGVNKSANQDEIKKAFRKLAHEHHPDKGGNADKFKEANEAYQVLGNEQKRKQYDQFGSSFQHGQAGGQGGFNYGGFNQGGVHMDFEDLGDIFGGMGDIFGFSQGGRSTSRNRKTRGDDLELSLSIDFMDAVFGVEKEIVYRKIISCDKCKGGGAEPGSTTETCKNCNGTGRVYKMQRTIFGNMQAEAVCEHCQGEGKIFSKKCSKCGGDGIVRDEVKIKIKIPAGINNGESIRLSGQGNVGLKGGGAGDLYLRIKVTPSKKFARDNYDINTKVEINIKQAILGDTINIETVDGPLKLKIPEGTQSGTIFRLREKGVPILNSRGRGDQLIEVSVLIPKGINSKNKKIISELSL